MHHHSPSWYLLSSEATANIHYEALLPAVIFTAWALCMVCLRWYSRFCSVSRCIRMEDYFVTAALLLSITTTAVIGGEFAIDGGHIKPHQVQLPLLRTMLRLVFAQSIFYHLSINLVKASFVLQYLRLFSLVPAVVRSCVILLVLIVGAAAWGVFGVVFLCKPVHIYWDVMTPGVCMDAENQFWSTSIIGIVLDGAIWLLPIPVVGRLRLPRRQKMGLLVVFGLGGFVCIVSILRLVLVHEAAHHNEMTKSGTYAVIFSTIEINVAIICASLLVMKPLFARFIPAIVGDQPLSAREERRLWREVTGLDLLEYGGADEEEKVGVDKRRDTAVGMGSYRAKVTKPERALDQRQKRPSTA